MRIAVAAALLLLFLAIWTLASSVVDNAFVLDAEKVVENREVLHEGSFTEILNEPWWPRSEGDKRLHRPTTLLYFAVVARLADGTDEARAYNMGNLFLHFLNALARFFLVALLLRGRRFAQLFAYLAALGPALHAISFESVVGMVGAAELLTGLFMTLSWYVFVLGWSKVGPMGGGLLCFCSVLFWFAAMLAKETAVFFPLVPILQVLMFKPEERVGRPIVILTLTLALLAGLGFIRMRTASLDGLGLDASQSVHSEFSTSERVNSSLAVLGDRYIEEVLWPRQLEPNLTHQDVPPPTGLSDGRVLRGLFVWLFLIAWTFLATRASRPSALFLLFAFVTYLPTSNLIVPIGALGAWRFLYSPLFGIFAALAIEVESAWRRGRWSRFTLTAALGMLTIFGATGTKSLIEMWQSPLKLYQRAYEFNPKSVWAIQTLQTEKFLRGQAGSDSMGLIKDSARFTGIEDELATLPNSDRLDRPTRLMAFKILMNLSSAYGNSAQMSQSSVRAANEAHQGARIALRAEAYLWDSPEFAFDARLRAFRLRQLELSQLRGVPDRDSGAEDFLAQEMSSDLRALNSYDRSHLGKERRVALALAAADYAELLADPVLAQRYLDDASQVDPSDPEVAGALARLQERSGKKTEALKSLEKAFQSGQARIDHYLHAIRILQSLGRSAEVMAYKRRIAEMSPTNPVEDRARQQILQELSSGSGK